MPLFHSAAQAGLVKRAYTSFFWVVLRPRHNDGLGSSCAFTSMDWSSDPGSKGPLTPGCAPRQMAGAKCRNGSVTTDLRLSHYVRFSNRPFEVKRFQAIHRHSFDVARGLALLFGLGTKALPSWDSRTRWNNLCRGLAVRRTAGPSGHANSPHPSSREGHHSTAWWSSSFLLLDLVLHGTHATAASRVHRNSVPSTQMRCMITANRRARATIAFFIPRRLAICIAQALSHDHFFECSML